MPADHKKVFPQPDAQLLLNAPIRDSLELLRFLVRCQERHGDYVLIDGVPGLSMYLLTDPVAVHHVLVTGHDNYAKPAAYAEEMERLMGAGLLTSEGREWLKQRRLSQPIFQAPQIPALLNVVSSCTINLMASWQAVPDGEWIDFHKEMLHLTNAIAVEWVFGSDTEGDGPVLKAELAETLFQLKMLGAAANQENSHNAAAQKIDRFHNLIVELIARRQQDVPTGDDLLSYYITATDASAAVRFTEQELLDEVKTLTIGGHHNGAAALSWMFYLLSINEDVQSKLHVELDKTGSGQRLSVAELGTLEYLRAILQESLRLYPPVWGTTREVKRDDEINGYELPAGSMVFLCQWITQRHPRFWVQPDTFDPDRFSNDRTTDIDKLSYFPFGRGPRQCIARDLSFMSLLSIASEVGRRYEFELLPGWKAEIDPTYVLAPRGGLPVRLRPRS